MTCFMRQAHATALLSTDDPEMHRLVMNGTGQLLSSLDLSLSPPENAVAVYGLIADVTGVADPFARLKTESNLFAMELREKVRMRIGRSDNPLYAALRYAIAGNIIDYGTQHEFDAITCLARCLDVALRVDDFSDFEQEVRVSVPLDILYLADNCGEIVFDGLLVEQLQRLGHRVVVAVRGQKILNDATMDDARMAGLGELCKLVSNGTSCPGTPLSSCSDELRRAFSDADLILSKGQGNFETLSEVAGPVYFLLTVKCPVVARHIVTLTGLPADTLTGRGEPILLKKEKCHAGTAD